MEENEDMLRNLPEDEEMFTEEDAPEGGSPEGADPDTGESSPIPKKGQRLRDWMKNRYPDEEFSDDDDEFGGRVADELDNVYGQHKRITDLFAKDKKAARFFTDMARGVNPWVSMVESIGIDGITDIFENPEYKEELAKAQESYLQRLADEENLEKEFNSNLGASMKKLEEWQKAKGMTDEQVDAMWEKLWGIINDAIKGNYTAETFDFAQSALSHDGDVENARREGEISGRNAKISEKMRKPKKDSVPSLAGSNNTMGNKAPSSIFELAKGAQ